MIFTSCASCGDILETTYTGQQSHPTCPQTDEELRAREFVDAIQRGDIGEADRLQKLIDLPPAPSLGSSALWYASVGWPVFPLLPNQKVPATRNGFKDASTDPSQIREWWGKADYNIGGATGILYEVLDIDGPAGFESVSKLDPKKLPAIHGKANTPRGQHWFTLASGSGNRAGIEPGLDLRGVGGYVVLPASRIDFHRYTWAVPPSPEILGKAS